MTRVMKIVFKGDFLRDGVSQTNVSGVCGMWVVAHLFRRSFDTFLGYLPRGSLEVKYSFATASICSLLCVFSTEMRSVQIRVPARATEVSEYLLSIIVLAHMPATLLCIFLLVLLTENWVRQLENLVPAAMD